MSEATTIVVALGLIGGAVYLATRKEKAPTGEDDGNPDLGACVVAEVASNAYGYKGGGAACKVVSDLVKPVVKFLQPKFACDNKRHIGAWSPKTGFTGRCYVGKDGTLHEGISEAIDFHNAVIKVCCPPGSTDELCKPGPLWSKLPGYCKDGIGDTPEAPIYDHRKIQ